MNAAAQQLMDRYFPDGGASILLRVVFEHGYGPSVMPLVERIYLDGRFSLPPAVLEAVQVLAHSSCENKYCAVFHARGLITLGFGLDDVRALVERQVLPEWVEGREHWEHSLRRVATLFHEPEMAAALYRQLSAEHSGQELEDLGVLIAFCMLDRHVLEFHSDEFDVNEEPIVFETIDCARELIHYFTREAGRDVPVFTICSLCKDIRTHEGWKPVELAVAEIPGEAHFSHGYCDACVNRELAR